MIAAMVPYPHLLADAPLLAALGLLLAAACQDVATRRISNRIPALLAAAGLLRHGLAGSAIGSVLLAALLVLLGGALLWRRGLLGGGDVKLLGAASLLLAPALVPAQLLAIA